MQTGQSKANGSAAGGGEPREANGAREFLAAHRLADLPEAVFQLGEAWALCERCSTAGDAAAAARLYPLLAAFAPRGEPAGPWSGAVAHYLGLLAGTLGRWDLAAGHFEDALRAAAAAGAAMQTRATQLGYARALLARAAPGDAVRAERLLGELLVGSRLLTAPAASAPPPTARVEVAPPARYVFRREGDFWSVAAEGRLTRLRGLRGFDYLAELLRHPQQELYVIDLAGLGGICEAPFSAAEALEQGLRVVAAPAADAALDRRARQAYRERWHELRAEADAAARDNDLGRMARLREEIDMLAQELAAATRGGRGVAVVQERARVNVRNCITAALRAIRRHDEPLWRHLANAIKTGTFCAYQPDRSVDWEM